MWNWTDSKKNLDKWPRGIPDTLKIDDYGVAVGAETNSVTKRKENNWWPCLWGSHVSTCGDKISNNNNNANNIESNLITSDYLHIMVFICPYLNSVPYTFSTASTAILDTRI